MMWSVYTKSFTKRAKVSCGHEAGVSNSPVTSTTVMGLLGSQTGSSALFFIELGSEGSGDQEEIVEHLVPVEDHRLYSFDVGVNVHAKSFQLCPTLCNPMDCSPPGASVYGILSGLPCPPPGDLPDPEIEHTSLKSPALADGFFTTGAT